MPDLIPRWSGSRLVAEIEKCPRPAWSAFRMRSRDPNGLHPFRSHGRALETWRFPGFRSKYLAVPTVPIEVFAATASAAARLLRTCATQVEALRRLRSAARSSCGLSMFKVKTSVRADRPQRRRAPHAGAVPGTTKGRRQASGERPSLRSGSVQGRRVIAGGALFA
jgi:hypothetical protein